MFHFLLRLSYGRSLLFAALTAALCGGCSSNTDVSSGSGGGGGPGSGGAGAAGAGGAGAAGAGGAGAAGGGTAGSGGAGGSGGIAAAGGAGAGVPLSDSQGVFVTGILDSSFVTQITHIDYPNNPTPAPLNLPELSGLPIIWSMSLSPLGDAIAVSASAPGGTTALLSYGLGSTAPGTALVDLSTAPNAGWVYANRLQHSPDGQWLAFTMDPDINNAQELYVVPVDGSAQPRRVSQPIIEPPGVARHAWSPDGQQIAFIADIDGGGGYNLFVVDAMVANAQPVVMVPPASVLPGKEVSFDTPVWNATGDRIYFNSGHELGTPRRLYRVQPNGTALEQVPGTSLSNGSGEPSIVAWTLSPDRSRLAFAADAPTANLHQVYVMDLPGGTPTVTSAVQTSLQGGGQRGPIFSNSLQWNPDNLSLAVISNWEVNGNGHPNKFQVFIVPAVGPPGGTRVLGHGPNFGLINQTGFSSDGKRLFVLADLLLNNQAELFTTLDLTTPDQDPQQTRVFPPPMYDPFLDSFVVMP